MRRELKAEEEAEEREAKEASLRPAEGAQGAAPGGGATNDEGRS
jgi:hypothetical protein